MTNEEKRKIDTLRNEGCGCTAIAAALGLLIKLGEVILPSDKAAGCQACDH